jgi:hypothetical protein
LPSFRIDGLGRWLTVFQSSPLPLQENSGLVVGTGDLGFASKQMMVGNRVSKFLKGAHRIPVTISCILDKLARLVQTLPGDLFGDGFHKILRIGNSFELMKHLDEPATMIPKGIARF